MNFKILNSNINNKTNWNFPIKLQKMLIMKFCIKWEKFLENSNYKQNENYLTMKKNCKLF